MRQRRGVYQIITIRLDCQYRDYKHEGSRFSVGSANRKVKAFDSWIIRQDVCSNVCTVDHTRLGVYGWQVVLINRPLITLSASGPPWKPKGTLEERRKEGVVSPHESSPQPSVDPRRERSERCVIDTRTARAVLHALKLTRVLEERRK